MSSGFFSRTSLRPLVAALAIALAGSMMLASTADARLGGGGSLGSRGSRTYSMPSATPTAPRVAPFERSTTPSYNPGFNNPGFGNARPGFFGGGFGRGLIGGFLGAGLFGLLFGQGFGGGLGGGMSFIGLILQLGLLYLAFRFIMGFFRNRQQPAFGGGSSAYGGTPGFGSGSSMNGYARQQQQTAPTPIQIGQPDYQTFEQRLVESQTAYSNRDISALRRLATPEMAGNFEQELAGNDRQGVVNRLSDVRLLSGDLSEAWREGASDYATVAMRFSLVDVTQDRSGRVVAGNPNAPQEVTEVWTFVRRAGTGPSAWTLSAIQQA